MVSEATKLAETAAFAERADGGGQKRERSEIVFPYSDLGSAIDLVRTIDEKAGGQCQVNQLAAWMSMSAAGGTFRSRYSAARIFGLIESDLGNYARITSLGKEVLCEQRAPRAKATAFLKVPLFKKIYEHRQGRPLPPATALAQIAKDLGVPPKQAERARQTFMKSAKEAQFIDEHTGNFIEPGFPEDDMADSASQDVSADPYSKTYGTGEDDLAPAIDPIISGLIRRLPKSGEVWPSRERKLWLEILKSTFQLVYKDVESESDSSSDEDELLK